MRGAPQSSGTAFGRLWDVVTTQRHDQAMTGMIDQIEARLDLVRLTAPGRAAEFGIDVGRAGPVLGAARAAVSDGSLGYALITAQRPG